MLYHTVALDAVAKSARPESFLVLNAGHRHVRKFVVHWPGKIAQVETYVSCLTAALPQNILEAFQCDAWSPTLSAIYPRLSSRQPKLKTIFVLHVGHESNEEQISIPGPTSAHAPNVEVLGQHDHVVLPIDGKLHEEAKSRLQRLRDLPMLETLAVRCATPTNRRPLSNVLDSELNTYKLVKFVLDGTCKAPGLLEHESPWQLESLLLQYSALHPLLRNPSFEVQGFVKVVSGLTSLVLQDSHSPGCLLNLLTRNGVKIHLRKLVIVTDSAWSSHINSERPASSLKRAVDRFLKRFSGLQTLAISGLSHFRLPSAESINNHSETLRELFIDNEARMTKAPEDLAEWYNSICNACTRLEQVGLPMPWITFWRREDNDVFELKSGRMRLVFTEAPSPAWATFKVCQSWGHCA